MLAYHYATALELARAAGEAEQAAELEAPALRFLTLAGERALGLDTTAALASFERALALTPPGHPERPEALARFAEAAQQAGRTAEAAAGAGGGDRVVPGARRPSRRRRGDGHARQGAAVRLGDPRCVHVAGGGTGAPRAAAARPRARRGAHRDGCHARRSSTAGMRPALGYAERAIALAEELGMSRSARALGFRGLARS